MSILTPLMIDLGRAVLVTTAVYAIFAVGNVYHCWKYNRTIMKAQTPMVPWQEWKKFVFSRQGFFLPTLALLVSMYASQSLVGGIVLGLMYIITAYGFFFSQK